MAEDFWEGLGGCCKRWERYPKSFKRNLVKRPRFWLRCRAEECQHQFQRVAEGGRTATSPFSDHFGEKTKKSRDVPPALLAQAGAPRYETRGGTRYTWPCPEKRKKKSVVFLPGSLREYRANLAFSLCNS